MRVRAGIAWAIGVWLALASGGCGPGLEPPETASGAPDRPRIDAGARPDTDGSEGVSSQDAAAPGEDDLDAGVENDHTNDHDAAP